MKVAAARTDTGASRQLAGRGQDPAITFLLLLPLGLLHLTAPHPEASGAWSLVDQLVRACGGWARPVLAAALALALLWSVGRIRKLNLAWRTGSLVALLEGVLWGLALGPVLRWVTAYLPLRSGPLQIADLHAHLALAAGAGLYEELIFRGLLLGGGIVVLELLIGLLGWKKVARPLAIAIALTLSSLAFAAAHRVGDPYALEAEVFAFRALAGWVFGGLFLLRGMAVAAWAHAGYDSLLLLG